jgi:hypothetical protein
MLLSNPFDEFSRDWHKNRYVVVVVVASTGNICIRDGARRTMAEVLSSYNSENKSAGIMTWKALSVKCFTRSVR